YKLYWKTTSLINTVDILSSIQQKILPEEEFAGISIQEIIEELELRFSAKKK
ncbi:10004_t:CDS:1, partial [Diversispora eburnea]